MSVELFCTFRAISRSRLLGIPVDCCKQELPQSSQSSHFSATSESMKKSKIKRNHQDTAAIPSAEEGVNESLFLAANTMHLM
jgi:hypothetical protein